MKWYLVVEGGAQKDKAIPIVRSPFRIGRGKDCTLRSGAASIAEAHCEFTLLDEALFLADLGSEAGTFVNDQRLTGERALKSKDRVRVGPLTFILAAVAPKTAASTKPAGPADEDVADMLLDIEDGEAPPAPEPFIPVKEKVERVLSRPKPPEKQADGDTSSSAAKLMRKHLRPDPY